METDPHGDRPAIDALTGLHDERAFHARFPEEFRRARESETNGALMVLRVDNIVAINARHGRSVGDDALRAVARILCGLRSQPQRAGHLAARLGGPLFAYYAPSCSAPEARAMAEEILRLVRQSEQSLARLYVSIGLVNLYELFLDQGTDDQVALRAEQAALYRLQVAGEQGANTICDSTDVRSPAGSGRTTVLLVDPEPASLELLVAALEAADIAVRVCEDGETALSLVESERPTVIIAEAMTPRLNGFGLRERLRSNVIGNEIPFILLSHKKNDELIRKALDLDIRHYFRKPISVVEVAGLVANLARGCLQQGCGV